jgi:hypothetical protein
MGKGPLHGPAWHAMLMLPVEMFATRQHTSPPSQSAAETHERAAHDPSVHPLPPPASIAW